MGYVLIQGMYNMLMRKFANSPSLTMRSKARHFVRKKNFGVNSYVKFASRFIIYVIVCFELATLLNPSTLSSSP